MYNIDDEKSTKHKTLEINSIFAENPEEVDENCKLKASLNWKFKNEERKWINKKIINKYELPLKECQIESNLLNPSNIEVLNYLPNISNSSTDGKQNSTINNIECWTKKRDVKYKNKINEHEQCINQIDLTNQRIQKSPKIITEIWDSESEVDNEDLDNSDLIKIIESESSI